MKRFKIIAVALLFVSQFAVFRNFWLTQMGSFLIYQDQITPADAILVLGGGEKERVLQAIELAKKKYSEWMMFTGDYLEPIFAENTHWALEAQKLAVFNGFPKNRTIPILDSKSTLDDALLAKKICEEKHFKSLIVVSEPFHTRRAHFVFDKLYKNSGIKIMMCPVQNSWYKRDSWWKNKNGFWATNMEYQKMLYYFLKGNLL